jgi:hypothetical protein
VHGYHCHIDAVLTMATTLANVLRYRFHSLNESDRNDILDGNEFFVQYIGCTAITEDYEMASDTQIEDFFNCVVSKYRESDEKLLFKLMVNRNGAMICDSESNIQHSFEAYNISHVTTTNTWRYSKYLIIVARTRQDKNLKGHVLLCKNKSKAQRICQTFTEMFKMARPITVATDNEEMCTKAGEVKTQNQAQNCDVFETGTRSTFDLKAGFPTRDLNKHTQCRVKNHNPLNDHKADEKLLDDGFTELAKSRSSSSHSADSSAVTPPLSGSFFNDNTPPYQLDDSTFY